MKTAIDPYTQEQLMMDGWRPPRLVSARVKPKKTKKVISVTPKPKIGDCPMCLTKDVKLTKDHIIPQWAIKSMTQHFVKTNKFRRLGDKNIQYICSPCNSKKGNRVDCSTPLSMEFWTLVAETILGEIKKEAVSKQKEPDF